MNLYGRDLLCSQDWSLDELYAVLHLASKMKQSRFDKKWTSLLNNKSFLMFFYSPSVRTRLSFETALTELGGHAQYMTPSMGRFKSTMEFGEAIEDAAQVISRYVGGIGIRIMEDHVTHYGQGHRLIKEYAKWATVPVINMADDRFHPCQALADILGWAEYFGNGPGYPNFKNLKKKRLMITWAKGGLARGWNSVHAALLIASRFGLDISLARPEGYDLDTKVYDMVRQNCQQENSSFEIISNPEDGYDDADIVYSRNWIPFEVYANYNEQREAEQKRALSYSDWIYTEEKMQRTNNAIFTHPMPIDRNNEVADSIASSSNSVVYEVAENRLHVQKAVLVHLMTDIDVSTLC